MSHHNQPRTTLMLSMLIGGLLGALASITLAVVTDTMGLIGIGPAIGTTLGMSIGMALENQQQNGSGG